MNMTLTAVSVEHEELRASISALKSEVGGFASELYAGRKEAFGLEVIPVDVKSYLRVS